MNLIEVVNNPVGFQKSGALRSFTKSLPHLEMVT